MFKKSFVSLFKTQPYNFSKLDFKKFPVFKYLTKAAAPVKRIDLIKILRAETSKLLII